MYTDCFRSKQNHCRVTPKPFKWRVALDGIPTGATWRIVCKVLKNAVIEPYFFAYLMRTSDRIVLMC